MSWVEKYILALEKKPETGYKKFDGYYLCPCCYYPTFSSRPEFDICPLCNWEDDGQDDHNANEILGGPNHGYSLTEARQNFKQYFTMYRPSDIYHFERTTIKKQLGKIIKDLTIIKREIITQYNSLLNINDKKERKIKFKEIQILLKKLK